MSKAKLQSTIAKAISSADTKFFTEDYPKQAKAVLSALEQAGYKVIPPDIAEDVWENAVNTMKTGRIKPHEHIKDVFEIVVKSVKL